MILNFSRSKTFRICKRKAFNWHHRRMEAARSMNLVDGGAFHKGVAIGRATKDWKKAIAEANELFNEDIKKSTIPEEQLYLIQDHADLVTAMLKCFETQYEHEEYQIIQPECEFDVAIPGSEHSCIFLHWLDENRIDRTEGPPPAEKILAHQVFNPHLNGFGARECFCWQPHRIVGKTDAIVHWNQNIWLDEYKTTAIKGQQFWDQWQMDVQPTIYMWGIWKSLGIRPRGFLLNSIFKPSENQVAAWNNKRKDPKTYKTEKDYIEFSREAFLRTEDDLNRAAQLMLDTARDWEEEVTSGSERMLQRTPFQYNPGSPTCMQYNRKCEYWSACLNHEQGGEFDAMTERSVDYVDEKLIQLVGAQ